MGGPRPDPFDGVWEEEIEPLLRDDPRGKAESYDNYRMAGGAASRQGQRLPAPDAATTTTGLAGRLNGPDQEVYFPQEHPTGTGGPSFDFTHGKRLGGDPSPVSPIPTCYSN